MIPALIINSPDSMKKGMAISGNELTEYIIRCGMIEISIPDSQIAIIELNPIANAIGRPIKATAMKPMTTNVLIRRLLLVC